MADFARLILRGGWLAGLAGLWVAAMLGGGSPALAWLWLALGLTGTGAALLHDLARLPGMGRRAQPAEAGSRPPALPLGAGIVLGLAGLGLTLWAGGAWCLLVVALVGLWGALVGPGRRFRPFLDGLSGLVRTILAAAAGFAALAMG